jgi:hypothetical protein
VCCVDVPHFIIHSSVPAHRVLSASWTNSVAVNICMCLCGCGFTSLGCVSKRSLNPQTFPLHSLLVEILVGILLSLKNNVNTVLLFRFQLLYNAHWAVFIFVFSTVTSNFNLNYSFSYS